MAQLTAVRAPPEKKRYVNTVAEKRGFIQEAPETFAHDT